MAQQALYRKWRSQTFDELVGQEHVVRTLRNAIRVGRVRHAYLFTGPRGTGKTSSARILAKAVNCLAPESERPCGQCGMCRSIADGSSLDLIEIDAASNTGVDKVRDAIIEKVNFAPSEARYKVYIIDEVHMLSASAFNALLKTLEEPPPYAIFILATTEVHKVPATILSRCQRLDFRRIPVDQIAGHLGYILEQEGIEAEPAVVELIARQATGSMRDAESLLDQLLAYGGDRLTLEGAREALGLATSEAVYSLVDSLLAQDVAGGLALINDLFDQGVDPRQFLSELLDYLRHLLLLTAGESRALSNLPEGTVARLREQARVVKPGALVDVIKLFNQAGADMRSGLQPQLPLELAVVEATLKLQAAGIAPAPLAHGGAERVVLEPAMSAPSSGGARRVARMPPSVAPEPAAAATGEEAAIADQDGEETPEEGEISSPVVSEAAGPRVVPPAALTAPVPAEEWTEPDETPPAGVAGGSADSASDGLPALEWWVSRWGAFLDQLKDQGGNGRILATRLKFCEPRQVEDGTLVLGFFYSIHRDKIEEVEARRAVESALAAFCGRSRVAVRCELAPKRLAEAPAKTKYEEAAEDPVVRVAMKLGGRIVDVRLPDQS